MKKFILLVLLIFSASMVQAQFRGEHDDAKVRPVRQALERIFKNSEGLPLSPKSKIYEVVADLKLHLQADASREDIKLIRENIGSDSGPVASILFSNGFNYNVLKYLRLMVNYDPTNSSYGIVDVATLMNTVTGMSPAGVPMFERLGSTDWKVNMGNVLELTYDSDIFWVLDRTRSLVDEAVSLSGTKGYGVIDYLRNDRLLKVDLLVDFTNRVEAVLNQFQGFLISIQIKANQHQSNEATHKKLVQLKEQLGTEKNQFLEEINSILDNATKKTGDQKPWNSIANAIRSKEVSLKKLEDKFRQISLKYLREADEITGTNKVANKYSDDTPIELNAARLNHADSAKKLRAQWNKSADHEYFKRQDRWIYEHWHSEEHGPYTLQSRENRSEDVNFTFIPPILEEQDVIVFLEDATERLTNGRPNGDQIREMREDLESKKAEHLAYVERGPKELEEDAPKELRTGYVERFQKRNSIIQQWLANAVESTFRQEAHEKAGYLGLQYSTDLRAKYESILVKLKKDVEAIKRSKWYTAGAVTGAAVAGSCYYYLSTMPQ